MGSEAAKELQPRDILTLSQNGAHMTVLVLLNASAGTIQRADYDVEAFVRNGFQTRGLDAEVRMAGGSQIAEMAHSFVTAKSSGSKPRTLVVGGGDGTLGSAASAVAGTDVVLGVLPLGTLNHLARDLGLSNDLDAAMDIIAAKHVEQVDVAEVNGRVFLNNSSIGIYPFLVAERTAEQKRLGVGKLAALGPALVRTLRASSWKRVRISVGDGPEQRTLCVFVGNNFYDLRALGHRGSLTSGELCVYVVKPLSWLGLALLPFKAALGLIDPVRDVELFRVQSLEIKARRRHLRIAMDGETVEAIPPLLYRIRPRSLRVLAPALKNQVT